MKTHRAQEDDEHKEDDEIEAEDGGKYVDEERGYLEGDVEEDDALVWRALTMGTHRDWTSERKGNQCHQTLRPITTPRLPPPGVVGQLSLTD